jgi:hypothetical protein
MVHYLAVKDMFQSNTATPYMNRELRKAIYNKQMLRNKFEKYHRQNMGGIQKTTQPCLLGCLFSSKIIPLPISFATFIKKKN